MLPGSLARVGNVPSGKTLAAGGESPRTSGRPRPLLAGGMLVGGVLVGEVMVGGASLEDGRCLSLSGGLVPMETMKKCLC